MRTLEEHNRQRQRAIDAVESNNYPRPNGIACPKCGAEMADKDNLVRASNPPKKTVICQACGHIDYAIR